MCTHQLKIASIFNTISFTSFYASSIKFFLYFLNTNSLSGYITTLVITDALYNHHLSDRSTTTIICPTLRHLLHHPHSSHEPEKTYFRKSILKNHVTTSVQYNVHIKFCPTFNNLQIPSIYL